MGDGCYYTCKKCGAQEVYRTGWGIAVGISYHRCPTSGRRICVTVPAPPLRGTGARSHNLTCPDCHGRTQEHPAWDPMVCPECGGKRTMDERMFVLWD